MDVQRYDIRADARNYNLAPYLDIDESDSGEWVRYSDHAAEVARLREALRIVHDWRGLCDENETATFDRIARQFQAETGYVRLGKDAPAALQQDREAAAFAWRRWVDDKNDSVNNVIRAALTARKDGA